MIKNCPICGKTFSVLYSDIWRYKRNNQFICSWKCIRLFDGKEEKQVKERVSVKRTRMKPEDMEEAVRLYKENDPGLDQFLTDHGVTNIPKWKSNTRQRYGAPALADAMEGMKSAEDEFFGKCEDMGLKTITDEDVEAKLPDAEEEEFEKRTTVTAIQVEGLGEFYFDKKFKSIDWRTEGGDEVSLGPAWWLQLVEDLPLILKKLGVEL